MVDRIGHRTLWTFVITSIALVMVMLDNLVVSTPSLNVIRQELGATIEQLKWTVNAYTLTFAVFLLTGAALGDRFRAAAACSSIGVAIFHGRLGPGGDVHKRGDAPHRPHGPQGIGAAIVTPLTLTLLSAAVPRRSVAA